MRFFGLLFALFALPFVTSCSSFNLHKKPPIVSAESEDSAENSMAAVIPDDGTEKIDAKNDDNEKKNGFFHNLAKAMGGDSGTPNVGPCPAVRVLYDASRFVEITGAEKFENIGYTGEIQGVNSTCRYVKSDPISAQLQIDMAIGKGPKAQGEYKDVKYWVAVTRKDKAVIDKKYFTGRVYFKPKQDRDRLITPPVMIEIPRANSTISGANFEILVGFDLSPAQLEFNRDGKRFRVDAGVPK